jgi:NAD+ synthase
MAQKNFSKNALKIDPAAETDRIWQWSRHALGRVLHKRGLVDGVSGGIDSSTSLDLARSELGSLRGRC